MTNDLPVTNVFSVDVEDYFQVSAFERHIRRDDWHTFESRVADNTRRLLELLARHRVRGTFFVLGWVAQRFAHVVREIHTAGHELASHGFWHRLVYEQTPGEFRQDVRDSRAALEDAVGVEIKAYRAPSFSITKRSLWALDILTEEGYQVDSSIFPVRHHRYGIPDAPRQLHQIRTPAGPLWEFPPSVVRLGGVNWPVSGGGYFRLYPLTLSTRALARINRQRRPFIFYIHPWELDPDQPRLAAGSRWSRLRHRVNLGTTESKIEQLLTRFRFCTLRDAIAATQGVEPGSAAESGRLVHEVYPAEA